MRRILVVNDFASRGGAEEVYRATVSVLQSLPSTEAAGFDGTGLDIAESARTRMWNPTAAAAIKRELQRYQPHVIWLHNYHNFLSPSILGPISQYKKSQSCEVWQTCHDFMPIFFSPEMLYHEAGGCRAVPIDDLRSIRSLIKRSSNKGWVHDLLKKMHWGFTHIRYSPSSLIDCFLCPSPFLWDALKRAGLDRSLYFPNPVDSPATVERRNRATDEGPLRLVFAGRLSYEKGLAEFIRLFMSVNADEKMILTVYGDGPERRALQAEFGQLLAAGILSMPGRLPHDVLQTELRNHDALVLPSLWYENAPMVIPEAAKNGLPILVRRFGSMATFGNDIGNKILFDATPEGLRSATQRLATEYNREPPTVFDLSDYTFERYKQRIDALLRSTVGA